MAETPPPTPGLPPDFAAQKARQEARVERVQAFLKEKWTDHTPCPFCGTDEWLVDPVPVVLQRLNARLGTGVPVFLVICTNCGFEAPIGAAFIPGMWEELGFVTPEESELAARPTEPETETKTDDPEPTSSGESE